MSTEKKTEVQILRGWLGDIEGTKLLPHDKQNELAMKLILDAKNSLEAADKAKDVPNEKDKKELNELVGQLNRIFKGAAPGTAFVLSLKYCKKLKQIWGKE